MADESAQKRKNLQKKLEAELSKLPKKQDAQRIRNLQRQIADLDKPLKPPALPSVPLAIPTTPAVEPTSPTVPASPKSGVGTTLDLTQALSNISGDVFIREGQYRGSFECSGRGIVRPLPGHRVRFDGWDGGDTFKAKPTLLVTSPNIVIDGSNGVLEVFNSYPKRVYRRGDQPNVLGDGPLGLRFNAPECKLINCYIHDTLASGIDIYELGSGAEVYGNIFFNGGTSKYDHSIYAHDYNASLKRFAHNIFVNNVGTGITLHWAHLKAGDIPEGAAALQSYLVEQNVFCNNGLLEEDFRQWTIGTGANRARSIAVRDNFTFQSNDSGVDLQLMYSSDDDSVVFERNLFCGGEIEINDDSPAKTRGNVLYRKAHPNQKRTGDWRAKPTGANRPDFQDTKAQATPTGVQFHTMPNERQAGRGHVCVYNFAGFSSVTVGVNDILKPGQNYKVMHAADPLGSAVLSGTYTGQPLQLPMKNLPKAAPVTPYIVPIPDTSPTFAAFLIQSE